MQRTGRWWEWSLSRREGRSALTTFGEIKALHRCALLVVVPGLDQNEGKRMSRVEVTGIQVKSVFKSLAATALHMAIQAPLCGRVIKAWPSGSNNDLVRMVVAHVLVEVIQVLLSPIAAVVRPPLLPGLDPSVHSSEIRSVLRRRLVFVDQDWRGLPRLAVLDNAIPVNMALFRKDEDHRMAVVCQISTAVGSARSNVSAVGLIKSRDCTVGGLGVVIGRFVVKKGDLEMTFVCGFLQNREIVVGERCSLTIPVDDKC